MRLIVLAMKLVHNLCVNLNFSLQGQTESKKRSRSVETKGTAMSFGFKKKVPAQKRHLGDVSKDSSKSDLNATNANILNNDNTCCIGDNNGNSRELENEKPKN